jgi:hypothetical protein
MCLKIVVSHLRKNIHKGVRVQGAEEVRVI